jgi:hypothetical protein
MTNSGINKLLKYLQQWLMRIRFWRPKPPAQPVNFNNAERILIVGAPKNRADQEALLNFRKELADHQKIVKILIFQSRKLGLPAITETSLVKVFSEKDLNYLGLPKSEFHKAITEQPYDLAINLSSPDFFLGHYILAIAKLSFTTAFYTEKYAYIYDFMVNLKDEAALSSGISDFKAYLKRIQKQ